MADQTQRLEIATVKAEVGSNILFRFANDAAEEAAIPTDSGSIQNLKQVIAEIQEEGAEKISVATTIYPTVATGLAATADGGIFLVQSSEGDEIYVVWKNEAGSAVNTGKTAMSSQAVKNALTVANEAAQAAEDAADVATNRTAGFLQPAAEAPTVRDNGLPLQIGDRYFNTEEQDEYIYKSEGWSANESQAAIADLGNKQDPEKGAARVGWDNSTVGAQMDLSKKLANYDALRAYTGLATRVEITQSSISGIYNSLGVVTGYTDLGGNYVISTNGRVWARDFTGPVHTSWFEIPVAPIDATAKIQAMASWAALTKKRIVWGGGKQYNFTEFAVTEFADWVTDGAPVALYSTKTVPNADQFADHAIIITSTYYGPGSVISADAPMGQNWVSVPDVSVYTVGMVVEVRSTRLFETDNRGSYREGQTNKVVRIDVATSRIYLEDPLEFEFKANITYTGALVGATDKFTLMLPGAIDTPAPQMRLLMTMTSGAAKGKALYIANWDNITKTATFDSKWGAGWSILPAAGDTFTIEWKTTIFKHSPGHCYIGEGFTLTRDLVTNAAPDFSGYGGLSVQYIDSLIIRDITVENFSMRNIDLQGCHHPKVFRPVLNNANYAYNRVDGLGYGISINQCSTPKIISPSGYGNRRLIDFAGVQSVTTNAEVTDGDAFGGGLTSVGLPWWPEGETTQGGYGSHGGAHRTKYINCKSRDLFLPYNIRGLDELVSDALHVGHCGDNLVYVQEGGSGVEVDGFKYMLRAFEYKEPTPYHIMDAGVRIPNHFIGIEVETNRLRVGRPVRVTRLCT